MPVTVLLALLTNVTSSPVRVPLVSLVGDPDIVKHDVLSQLPVGIPPVTVSVGATLSTPRAVGPFVILWSCRAYVPGVVPVGTENTSLPEPTLLVAKAETVRPVKPVPAELTM